MLVRNRETGEVYELSPATSSASSSSSKEEEDGQAFRILSTNDQEPRKDEGHRKDEELTNDEETNLDNDIREL